MAAGGNKGFGDLLTSGLDEASSVEQIAPAEGVIASRSSALTRLATGKMVTDRTEFVDPNRCRPWRLHNRELEQLNEENCRDLIDAFLAAKRQRIPAIVRRTEADPEYDFEIVAGVRRWWTVKWLQAHHHPEFEYLITIQRLTDEEAFRVSDLENRSRKDITDWERGQDYTRALSEFYGGSQTAMAEHLNISKSWLTRLLDVARLPPEIIRGFASPHDITVRIAREIKPAASDPKRLERMIIEAEKLDDERSGGGNRPSGVEVGRRLIRASREAESPSIKSRKEIEVLAGNGKPMLRYFRAARGGLTMTVLPKSGAARGEVLDAIGKLLDSAR